MSRKRYSEEFKREVVKHITKGGYAETDVARRQGFNNNISPVEFEKQYAMKQTSV